MRISFGYGQGSGGDARWSDDLQAERLSEFREAVHVRRLRRRRWDLAAFSRLSEGAREALEPGGLGDEQEACHLRADDERVRHALRSEHERAGGGNAYLAVDPEGQLALQDVEPLVLAGVDVKRGSVALRGQMLDHRNSSAGGLGRC